MRLHVSIPTFNRAPLLRRQLFRLKAVKDRVGQRLSISVHDNSSSDETAAVCRDISARGLDFEYFVNSRNLGLARNLRKCVIPSSADYLWILSDDDPVNQHQLIAAINHVTPGKSLIIFNSSMFDMSAPNYFAQTEIDSMNQLDSLPLFEHILVAKPVLAFWISGFWASCGIAQQALDVPVSHENMMFPLLLSGLSALCGQIEVSPFNVVCHRFGNDQWSKKWGKLVMWTDKREITLELVRRGLPLSLIAESRFVQKLSLKQLISLLVRYPKHSCRTIVVNAKWLRAIG